MKKVILSTLLVAGSLVGAKAQSIHFGLKAGLNVASMTHLEEAKSKASFYGGGFVNIGLGKTWAIQPEVLYSGQGAKSDSKEVDATINTGYISVPVMVQYHIVPSFYVEAGPQVSILASAKMKAAGQSEDIKSEMKGADFGLGLGCGFKITKSFGVNARYVFGVSDAFKEDEGDKKTKNAIAQVGVFYQF
ncbi:porin family protein [Chitinophaga sp. Cy-1792]|uniref:porin family protein n=1 Tax=Chitinophaga sp. Cy-1792 TaxID=2608339 RepID=UPI00141DF778|nr:porin family protein [Chitinophaga sp. Cy-1792]NIG53713.1 PorT family protein [Chitinophaga sp. Cy-1792]